MTDNNIPKHIEDQFIVWCRVEGGVTGLRQGPLKLNGVPILFDTEALAQQAATDAYKAATNGTARYTYTVRPASVLSPEEIQDAEEREYYRNIDECAALGINRIISNGCPEHATYLMTKMLERAHARIRLFSGALRDEVDGVPCYGSKGLIRAACGFLCAASRRIEIVVQNDPGDLDAHVFIQAIREAKGNGTLKGSLVVRKAASATSFDQHFMVADNRAYRLETGGREIRATANFEDPEFALALIDAFDGLLFGSGTDLLAI